MSIFGLTCTDSGLLSGAGNARRVMVADGRTRPGPRFVTSSNGVAGGSI